MPQPPKKHIRSPRRPIRSNEAWRKITDTACTVEILRCLRSNDVKRVAEAVVSLKQVQDSSKRQKYQLFLHDVLRRCGPHLVLLCAIALGQNVVIGMRNSDRDALVDELERKRNQAPINHPILRSLSNDHHVPHSVEVLNTIIHDEEQRVRGEKESSIVKQNNPNVKESGLSADPSPAILPSTQPNQLTVADSRYDAHGRNAAQSRAEAPTSSVISTHRPNSNEPAYETPSKNPNAQEDVFEHPSLEGIAKVFDQYICKAIRRVLVHADRRTSWKASVTMVFPLWGGPVDCLMSLDVCEEDVEHLAMALFGAQVKWVEQVLHIVLKEGIALIIPNSEATLKGVRDEAIIKVFGPEICNAIDKSPVLRRELDEGKHRTECVSMILTKNGAIINLSLDLRGGLQIRNKLYN